MITLKIHGVPPGISSLPSELILRICQLLPHEDLTAFARVNCTTNQITTPFLYRHITLTNSSTAYHCLATLADSPKDRDLARHVLSLAIESFLPWNFGPKQMIYFKRSLVRSIFRMVHIRSFRCMLAGSFGDDVADALSCRAKTLTSLSVSLPFVPPCDEARLSRRDALGLRLPLLESFEFDYVLDRAPLCPLYERFVRNILTLHSSHLKHLKFPPLFTADYLLLVLPRQAAFPALESITLLSSAFTNQAALKLHTATALTFPFYELIARPALPSGSLPFLTTFSGSCRIFSDILNVSAPRPIRTVQFDGAAFDMEDTSIIVSESQPTWRNAFGAFLTFQNSTGPVRELSFYVRSVNVLAMKKCAPLWSSLESVTMCLRADPKSVRPFDLLFLQLPWPNVL